MTFADKLAAVVAKRGPLCVGIDPHPGLLHAWGLTDDPAGLETFARTAVQALGERAAVIKPQSAFFERHGSAGIAVLERTLADIRAAGALALLDVKRGDIGSTMAAYASAYLDPASPLAADAVTASPYVGIRALEPLFNQADAAGAGVFVLALTSNADGVATQLAQTAAGLPLAEHLVGEVAARNAAGTAGTFGVVVGATVPASGPAAAVLAALPGLGGPILAPGVGAQGATVADLPLVFGAALPAVLPAVSREILRHGPDPAALAAAAAGYAADLAALGIADRD